MCSLTISIRDAFSSLQWSLQDFVVSSKYMYGGEGLNNCMLSNRHLIEATNLSLQRIKLSHLDIVYAHRFDFDKQNYKNGKVFYGISQNGLLSGS